jgi:hypothetical protein
VKARVITHVVVGNWYCDNPATETAAAIDRFYRRIGYLRSPYHYIIKPDGFLVRSRPLGFPGGMDLPNQAYAVTVGLIVGRDQKEYPDRQRQEVNRLVRFLQDNYHLPDGTLVHINNLYREPGVAPGESS